MPLILVDGSSYLYRAFHALPPLNTSSGQPTGAIKGVISMLRRMQKDFPDSPMVVVFDAKGKTFRDELFEHYKAHRPPMPEDLRLQVEPIQEIVQAMGLPLLIIDGVEADDVIGTLAKEHSGNGGAVVISTGDKDMAQLVDLQVTLLNTMTNTRLDSAGVVEKFGVAPELIVDYLALVGDKSDNIPGVPGIGEKTALALLGALGNLDQIYSHLDEVAELGFRGAKNMPAKLAEHREQAYLSRSLATIKTDVALGDSEHLLGSGKPDKEHLLELFSNFEFKAWTEELLEADPPSMVSKNENRYEVILTETELDDWIARLTACEVFAIDTETTSLNYMIADLVGVSVAVEPGHAAYIPVGHDYLGAPQQLDRGLVLKKLRPLLESEEKKKVGQNLKYDLSVLARHGIAMQGLAFDTMLESYVLDSVATRHDMDSLALKYLAHNTIKFVDIAGKGASQLTFNQIDLQQAAPYAAEDADITLRLHRALWHRLEETPFLAKVFREIEMPLVAVLSKMERNGTLVDARQLHQQSQELAKRLAELEAEAYALAGEEFNLSSPKQLGAILFEKLHIPVLAKTAKGAPSTKEEVLQELALDYPLPRVLLEHRSLAKLKSTYTDKLPKMINPGTGRIHTSYHQAGAATGRLSSSDPNLQNIPVRTAEGRRIRQAFIAPQGKRIVAADYSQIELRIMAHLSGDRGLLDAFREGLDIHSATASEVFSTPLDQVTPEQRRSAKAINFGLIYGMSSFGLSRQLNVGRREAQDYIDLYFDRYPGVARYMDGVRHLAREQGYVETLFGRRLYLPDIKAGNGQLRQAAERTAINAPMQGTAADIIKRAMVAISGVFEEMDLPSLMIMQVHDELVFEVPAVELDRTVKVIREGMEQAAELSIPLIVEVGIGDNWDEAH